MINIFYVMSSKKQTTWWKSNNEKYLFILLPKYFKIIGALVSFGSIITLLIINNISYDFERINLINEILYYLILLGLIFVSFSKDKYEDERIANLRFRSFSFAVGVMTVLFVFQTLFDDIFDLIFSNEDHQSGIYDGLFIFIIFLLLAQLLYFYKFKADL